MTLISQAKWPLTKVRRAQHQTARKVVLQVLTEMGVSRQDDEFKDLFSAVYKGTQFALVRIALTRRSAVKLMSFAPVA